MGVREGNVRHVGTPPAARFRMHAARGALLSAALRAWAERLSRLLIGRGYSAAWSRPSDEGHKRVPQHRVSTVERHVLSRAHHELDRVLARVEGTAEVVGTLDTSVLAGLVSSLLNDLDTALLPHMEWEEKVCFPEADVLAATPWATRLLRLQHDEIRGRLEQLRAANLDQIEPHHPRVTELRAHLYALHALVTSHLEQEEHAVLTLLVPQPSASHETLGDPASRPAIV